jgi:hypothetical protein
VADPSDNSFIGPRPIAGPSPVPTGGADVPFREIVEALQAEQSQEENILQIRDNVTTDIVPDLNELVSLNKTSSRDLLEAEEERAEEVKDVEKTLFDKLGDRITGAIDLVRNTIPSPLSIAFANRMADVLSVLGLAAIPAILIRGFKIDKEIAAIGTTLFAINRGLFQSVFTIPKILTGLARSTQAFFTGTKLASIGPSIVKAVQAATLFFAESPRILRGVEILVNSFIAVKNFAISTGSLLQKIVTPVLKFLGFAGGIFKTIMPFFKVVSGILGKIFIPITVVLGIIQGLSDYFRAGGQAGIGGLLTSVVGGLLESFTFGLLDIERIFGFFDLIATSVRKAVNYLLFDFTRATELEREFQIRKEERERKRADRLALREGKATRETIKEASEQELESTDIFATLSKELDEVLSLISNSNTGLRDTMLENSAQTNGLIANSVAANAQALATQGVVSGSRGGGRDVPTPAPTVDPYNRAGGRDTPGGPRN